MGGELPVVDYAFSDGSTRYKKNIKSIPTEPASSGPPVQAAPRLSKLRPAVATRTQKSAQVSFLIQII